MKVVKSFFQPPEARGRPRIVVSRLLSALGRSLSVTVATPSKLMTECMPYDAFYRRNDPVPPAARRTSETTPE